MLQKLTIPTSKPRQVINLTSIINDLLSKNISLNGLCFIYCTHTSCAITTAEFEGEEASDDYIAAYEAMMPKLPFKHAHNPTHFGDHFASSITGTSLFVPVQSASLVLGTNQKIVLVEFQGPRERHLNITFLSEDTKSAL